MTVMVNVLSAQQEPILLANISPVAIVVMEIENMVYLNSL